MEVDRKDAHKTVIADLSDAIHAAVQGRPDRVEHHLVLAEAALARWQLTIRRAELEVDP